MKTDILKDRIFWLLFIFSCVYVLGNIGTGSLSTWDEAVYANISGNILKTGDWLVMHEGSRPWFDKPPLYMWCTVFFYNMFGINEFSVRLTSSIFGIAAILLVYIFVKKISSGKEALLASLVLLVSPQYIRYSKMGMLDVTLTFFITLMLYLFWLGQENPRYLLWSGLTFLFAYLTKGAAAIFGPAVIFLYCLFSGNLKLLIKREFISGILISIIAVFAFHLSQYLRAGPESISSYFGFHLFKRTTTVLEGHAGGLNFYQKVIFNKNKPWSVLFYASFAYILWLAIKNKDKRAMLITAWVAGVYAVCSIVRTKLHWYVIPIYPAFAISSAYFLGRFFKDRMFPWILSFILLGALVQIPISYAFKLDFNAKAKDAALYSKKLPYVDNGTIFYYETVKLGKQRSI